MKQSVQNNRIIVIFLGEKFDLILLFSKRFQQSRISLEKVTSELFFEFPK